jgi:hypothetical protein
MAVIGCDFHDAYDRASRPALEALIRFSIVQQVAEAVGGVLEQGGCREDQHAGLGVDEWDDLQRGNEAEDLGGS